MLPSEAAAYLTNPLLTTPTATPPFIPRQYGSTKHESELKQNGIETKREENCPKSIPVVYNRMEWRPKFHNPPKTIMRPVIEVYTQSPDPVYIHSI